MVPGIPAKEIQVGEVSTTLNSSDGPILCGWQLIGQQELSRTEGGSCPWNASETLNTGGPVLKNLSEQNKGENSQIKNQSGIPPPTPVGCLTHLGSAHQHPPCGSSLHIPTVLPGRLPETAHCLGIPLRPAIQALNQGQRQHSARQLPLGHSPAAGTQPLHPPGPRSHRTPCPMNLHARAPLVQSSRPHPQTHEAHLPLERGSTISTWCFLADKF